MRSIIIMNLVHCLQLSFFSILWTVPFCAIIKWVTSSLALGYKRLCQEKRPGPWLQTSDITRDINLGCHFSSKSTLIYVMYYPGFSCSSRLSWRCRESFRHCVVPPYTSFVRKETRYLYLFRTYVCHPPAIHGRRKTASPQIPSVLIWLLCFVILLSVKHTKHSSNDRSQRWPSSVDWVLFPRSMSCFVCGGKGIQLFSFQHIPSLRK